MSENSSAASSITLEGVWAMESAADLLKLLSDKLARLMAADPGARPTDIDMSGVVDLDACGCQLLAVFLEELRRRGLPPIPRGIRPEVAEKIALLGFSGAFDLLREPKEEAR